MADVRSLIFKKATDELRRFISGRENLDEKLDPTRNGNATFASISLYVGGYSQGFNVHCDARCAAVAEFLKLATPENICITSGPEGGTVLGIDDRYIPKFYVYQKN